MRTTGLAAMTALALAAMPAVAVAGAADICTNAGFRAGTVAFTSCVGRVGGDDPLAALEQAEADKMPATGGKVVTFVDEAASAVSGDGKPGLPSARVPDLDGEFPAVSGAGFPASFDRPATPPPSNGPLPSAPPASPPPPASGGFVTAPTAPTPPQINTFTVTMPAWTWGQ